jgi:hypothetical protein
MLLILCGIMYTLWIRVPGFRWVLYFGSVPVIFLLYVLRPVFYQLLVHRSKINSTCKAEIPESDCEALDAQDYAQDMSQLHPKHSTGPSPSDLYWPN